METSIPARGMQRRGFVRKLVGILSLPLLPGCSGPVSTDVTRAEQRGNIETNFDATLARCYLIAPTTRELVGNAVAVLAFPTVGLVNPVTREWAGMGVLREGLVFTDYYFLSIPKYDVAGETRTRSILFLFNSLDALNKFRVSNPWRASEATAARNQGAGMRNPDTDVLTLVLRGNALMTNPAMPEMFVVPLDI